MIESPRMSIDSLCYELVNKRFRNPVLGHARARLGAKFSDALDSEIQSLFQKEWEAIERSLGSSAAAGLTRQPIDNLDRLSVGHFRNLFEKYYTELVPAGAIPEGNDDLFRSAKRHFLMWLDDVKDVRNPMAHPPEEDLSIFDALKLADSCLRVVNQLQLNSAVSGLQQIHQVLLQIATASDDDTRTEPSGVLATLPSRESMYDEFVGRTAELEELWNWFADDSSRRWVLVGDGGKGKSAIAFQFALSVQRANPDAIAAVIWISAKRRRYQDSTVVPIGRPDFVDLDSALDGLLAAYGDTANLGKTRDVRREVALRLLDDFPSLVVVDDIDSVEEEDEDVVEFFTFDAPRTATKVLLTSRRMYPGMGRSSTKISGLNRADALSFVRVTAGRLGLEAATGPIHSAFDKIYEVTEGSPLYIEDLLRLCRQLRPREAIDRWRQQGGDAARRYALSRESDLLSPAARRCLEAACWARAALSVAQFESILGLTEDEAVSAVRELEARFLVPTPEVVEGVPAYRAHRNLEVLIRQDLRSDPAKLELRNAVEMSMRGSGNDPETSDVIRQVNVRLKSGRAHEALEIAERALQTAPANPDLLAIRAEALAGQSPPRMTDARQDWGRAAQLGLARRSAFLFWSKAELRAGDWRRAYAAAELGLERLSYGDAALSHTAGYAASRCGQSMLRGLDQASGQDWLLKAEARLREALGLFIKSNASDYEMDRVHRALVVNAQHFVERRDEQVVYWTKRWLEDSSGGAAALEEARRQAPRYSAVREALEAYTN